MPFLSGHQSVVIDLDLVCRFGRYLDKLYDLQVGRFWWCTWYETPSHSWYIILGMSKNPHLEYSCHLILPLFSSFLATFGLQIDSPHWDFWSTLHLSLMHLYMFISLGLKIVWLLRFQMGGSGTSSTFVYMLQKSGFVEAFLFCGKRKKNLTPIGIYFLRTCGKFSPFMRFSARKSGGTKHRFYCSTENHFRKPHFFHGKLATQMCPSV